MESKFLNEAKDMLFAVCMLAGVLLIALHWGLR